MHKGITLGKTLYFSGFFILYALWEWQKTIASPLGDFVAYMIYIASFFYPLSFILFLDVSSDKEEIFKYLLFALLAVAELIAAYMLWLSLVMPLLSKIRWLGVIFYPIAFTVFVMLLAYTFHGAGGITRRLRRYKK